MLLDSLDDLARATEWERVFFISNDPRISAATFEGLTFGREDCIIQFNHAQHDDYVRSLGTNLVYVFNKNHMGSYWGFNEYGQPNKDYVSNSENCRGLVFTWDISKNIEEYLKSLPQSVWTYCFNYKNSGFLLDGISGKSPSAGYQIVALFHHLNQVCRAAELKLITIGFTGVYPLGGSPFLGHDKVFENKVMKGWSDVSLIGFAGEPL